MWANGTWSSSWCKQQFGSIKLFRSLITNAKFSVLPTVIGHKVYITLLRGLLAPTLPKEKSYKELKKVLKEHYEPKPLVIAKRFHFYKRGQAAGESLADYQAELRRLARTCDFGSFLNEAL